MTQMQAAFAKVVPDMVECWQALTDQEREMELAAAGFRNQEQDEEKPEDEAPKCSICHEPMPSTDREGGAHDECWARTKG